MQRMRIHANPCECMRWRVLEFRGKGSVRIFRDQRWKALRIGKRKLVRLKRRYHSGWEGQGVPKGRNGVPFGGPLKPTKDEPLIC